MQKRARAVETQKLRRTIKARTRITDPCRDGIPSSLAYIKLAFFWFTIILLDMGLGFRFELLWPFWLVVRAGFEALHKNGNTFVTLANHNSAKFSVLFVCVTATSDLICYLFIPVRILIFLASTYVWMHLVWHTNGGFVRTMQGIISDRSQCLPVLLLWMIFVLFEISCRYRCDYMMVMDDGGLFSIINTPGCSQVQGLAPVIPRSLNAFFGAHCIGYPLVIVSFGLRYHFKEWRIRRKQEEVSKKNEVLIKILTEALPAVYEGPKQYQSRLEQESLEYELSGAAEVPMILPPVTTTSSNGTVANGNSSGGGNVTTVPSPHLAVTANAGTTRKSSLRHQPASSSAHRKDKKKSHRDQRTPPETRARAGTEADVLSPSAHSVSSSPSSALSASSNCWGTERTKVRSLWRALWDGLTWFANWLLTSTPDVEDASSFGDDDEDDDSSIGDELTNQGKKNGRLHEPAKRNAKQKQKQQAARQSAASAASAAAASLQAQQQKAAETRSSSQQNEDKVVRNGNGVSSSTSPLSNGHTKREESMDKREREKENNNHGQNIDLELSRVRSEMQTAKAVEADLKLQLSVAVNGENRAKQEVTQLRSRLEQIQARLATLEKSRDQDRASTTLLERKYAELANRKNDVEKELIAERRARMEDAGREKNRADISMEHREKEIRLEAEADRLRSECVAKDDILQLMEINLHQLKEYKEKNDVEGLEMELRILREKNAHLEQALAAENKLKQELFRALGDAKADNQALNAQLDAARSASSGISSPDHLSIKTTSSSPLSSMAHHQEKGSPMGSQGVHPSAHMPPPPYHDNLPNNFMPYSFAQPMPGVSPTGEHLLFDTSSLSASSLPCALSPHEALMAGRMGKFGAPSPTSTVSHVTQRSN